MWLMRSVSGVLPLTEMIYGKPACSAEENSRQINLCKPHSARLSVQWETAQAEAACATKHQNVSLLEKFIKEALYKYGNNKY